MEILITKTLAISQIRRGGLMEFFIHGQKKDQVTEAMMLNDLFSFLSANNAWPAAFRIFCPDTTRKPLLHDYAKGFSNLTCPVTWISQNESGTFAIQVQAFSGISVESIKRQETIVGCRYADDDAEYLQLSFVPDDLSANNSQQAAAAFDECLSLLSDAELDFRNVARTWLFTSDILSWYDKLNHVRNDFFDRHDIFNTVVPASTGVGVTNPAGSELAFEALAVNPKNSHVHVKGVDSPLQCAALNYRSSFSRATQIQTPSHRRLLVSGTASIDPEGNTIFLDDPVKQIEKTMEVTEALLHNAGMGWENVVRGIMYFKNAGEFDLFDAWCRKNNVEIQHIKVHADICRSDLLFELEIDAIV